MSLFAILLITPSCSTIFNGSHQDINVMASPSDASISVDGFVGSGHMIVPVKRGSKHLIEVKKDGYQTVDITTGSGTAGWYFGNLIFGGIIGEVIDIATGSAYSVNPDPIMVSLQKGDGAAEQQITSDTSTAGIVIGIVLSLALYAVLFL
jgi:hypothetical protein